MRAGATLSNAAARSTGHLGAVDREDHRHGAAAASQSSLDPVDLLALDDALARLAAFDPCKAQIVEPRDVGGRNMAESAGALAVSLATAGRGWAVARM